MSGLTQSRIGWAVLVSLGLAGQPLLAGPLSDRITAAGRIEVGISPDIGEMSIAGTADAALSLGWGFSLNLGLYGAATDLTGDIDTPHETYGTLGWEGRGLSFAIGVPRPAYDGFAVSALDRINPVQAISSSHMGATRSRATWGAIHDGELPLGLRVAGTSAQVDWAASLHHMDDLDVASFGGEWSPGGTAALRIGFGGEIGSDSNNGAKASVDQQFGAVTLGAAVFFAPTPDAPDLAEAHFDWQPQTGLDLSVVLLAPRGKEQAAYFGVEKSVGETGFLKGSVGVAGGDVSSLISFGMTFGR